MDVALPSTPRHIGSQCLHPHPRSGPDCRALARLTLPFDSAKPPQFNCSNMRHLRPAATVVNAFPYGYCRFFL